MQNTVWPTERTLNNAKKANRWVKWWHLGFLSNQTPRTQKKEQSTLKFRGNCSNIHFHQQLTLLEKTDKRSTEILKGRQVMFNKVIYRANGFDVPWPNWLFIPLRLKGFELITHKHTHRKLWIDPLVLYEAIKCLNLLYLEGWNRTGRKFRVEVLTSKTYIYTDQMLPTSTYKYLLITQKMSLWLKWKAYDDVSRDRQHGKEVILILIHFHNWMEP